MTFAGEVWVMAYYFNKEGVCVCVCVYISTKRVCVCVCVFPELEKQMFKGEGAGSSSDK